jgi:Domain of Unknown Function (DUF1080)
VSELLLTRSAWRGYRLDDFPTESWNVDEDALHALPGAKPVDLVSRQRFRDFDLSLHWRLPVGGNSGVLYRVTEERDVPWQTGPEMQLLDNSGHPDGRVPQTSCGALYGLLAPRHAPVCPPGMFNVARIRVHGPRVEHWLNGVRVLTCDTTSVAFWKRVQRSKFRNFPQFARSEEGNIVLQHHGTGAWFGNIRIEVPAVDRDAVFGRLQASHPG